MSADDVAPISFRRRPPGRLGAYAPWPLVGVVLLLVALIIMTPVLIANSHQPSPGILTQAELVVDKISSNGTVHFYVWALGETIRYDEIRVGVATKFNWTGNTSVNWTRLNWTQWYNSSDSLSVILSSSANPIGLNISAHYVSPSGTTWYIAVLAFYVGVTAPPNGESLYSATDTPGVTLISPVAVSNSTLPVPILLYDAGPGWVP